MNPITKTSVKIYISFLVVFIVMAVVVGSSVFTQSRTVVEVFSQTDSKLHGAGITYGEHYLRFPQPDYQNTYTSESIRSFIAETNILFRSATVYNDIISSLVLFGLIAIMYGNMFFLKSGSYGMFYNLIPVKRGLYYKNYFIGMYVVFLITYLLNAMFIYLITRGANAAIYNAASGLDFFGSYLAILNYNYLFIFLALSVFGFFAILLRGNITGAVCSIGFLTLPIIIINLITSIVESITKTNFMMLAHADILVLYAEYKRSIIFYMLGTVFHIRGYSSWITLDYAPFINAFLLGPIFAVGILFTVAGRLLFMKAQFLSYKYFNFQRAQRLYKIFLIPVGALFALYFVGRWFV